MKILLTGYYGFGNLGDDLLFISNYRLICKLFPNVEIDVYTEAPEPYYLEQLLNHRLKFLNYASSGSYDYLWHGGGGVFFDFEKGKSISLIINSLIRIFGANIYNRLYEEYRKLKKKPILQFKNRIGFGLGVGVFTNSSDKYRDAIYKLSRFSLLVVRDEESMTRARKLSSTLKLEKSTDIVFDTELWKPEKLSSKSKKHQPYSIGIILRDWTTKDGYDYIPDLIKLANFLSENGYKINCFAFDANADKGYIKKFQDEGYEIQIWQPVANVLGEYLTQLSDMDYLITSRFHGAIVGACLGVPGMCVEIEDKLLSAVKMLQGSYSLLNLPVRLDLACELIEKDFLQLTNLAAITKKAVKDNCEILKTTFPILKKELHG